MALSIVQGPLFVALCQTLISRFATFHRCTGREHTLPRFGLNRDIYEWQTHVLPEELLLLIALFLVLLLIALLPIDRLLSLDRCGARQWLRLLHLQGFNRGFNTGLATLLHVVAPTEASTPLTHEHVAWAHASHSTPTEFLHPPAA